MRNLGNMVKISCECKDTLKLGELTEFQGELKSRTDEEIDKIVRSIKKHGFSFPFFVWKHDGVNNVLDGHGRLLALHKLDELGFLVPPLPVVYVDCKDEQAARDLLLRLNSHYGTMTKESVLEFIGDFEIDVSDLELPCGTIEFDTGETLNAETEGDDEIPDVGEKEPVISQRGEMYELGNSILMCGDSTNEEDVARLMGTEKASMVFTDPPYNVAVGSKNKALNEVCKKNGRPLKGGRIEQDIEGDSGQTDEEVGRNLWLPAFTRLFENSKDDCAIYVTMPQGGTHMMMMMMMMSEAGWQVKHELIWVKNQPTFSMGRLNYDYQHEPILYGWKKSHKWFGKGKFDKSIWNINKPASSKLHPTMKPVELVENAILNSSEKNDLILDLFGGSGTTLIACEKNNRKARLMELDPHYCDVIRRRYTKWAKENNRPITSGCLE